MPFPLLDLNRVTSQGPFAMPDSYFELRVALAEAQAAGGLVLDEVLAEFAATERTLVRGSSSRTGSRTRTHAIVVMGSSAGTVKDVVDELREEGQAVGALQIRCFRPFPTERTAEALRGVTDVAVLDRADSPGGRPPLYAEVAGLAPSVRSHVYGLGGRDLHPEHVRAVFAGEAASLRRAKGQLMSRLKTLVRNERGTPPLRGGHALCQGCGIPLVVRTVLDSIETPKVVVSATGCLEVATTRYPTTAWNVPWLHVAFENSAAVVSGIESAYKRAAPARRPAARRPTHLRRLRRRRRHVRHRPAGALRRARARPPLRLRLLRQ